MACILNKTVLQTALALWVLAQLGTACGGTAEADLAASSANGTGGCSPGDASCGSPPECPWGTPNPFGLGCSIVEGCGSPSAMCDPTCPGYDPCRCSGAGNPACPIAVGTGGNDALLSLEEELTACKAGFVAEPPPSSAGLGGMGGNVDTIVTCSGECGFCTSAADCCPVGSTSYCLDNHCIAQ